jgi:hypothetical protein
LDEPRPLPLLLRDEQYRLTDRVGIVFDHAKVAETARRPRVCATIRMARR